MRSGRVEQRIEAAARFEAQGDGKRAEREYRAALEIAPRHLVALNNLGFLYAARGRFAEAAPLFRRAAVAHPADTTSLVNLAGVLRELGDEAGAVEAFARVVAADPASRSGRLNLANTLRSLGRLDQGRPHYQTLLERDPGDGLARWNLAALEGLAGDWDAAFAGFALHHALQPPAPPPALPRWTGALLEGRRIRLEADQGLGDTLMFARLVRRVADRGGAVILRGQPALAPLLEPLDGLAVYSPRDRPAPDADVWFPLVDLPALPAIGAGGLEWSSAYVSAPADRQTAWSARLPKTGAVRVGLVWAGNPTHPDDRNRSMTFEALFRPLTAVAGVELISLQVGPRGAEADGAAFLRAGPMITDFADTAAALAELDLVISVDTSVLHLAGAMGRPAWALLPYAPDWRWRLSRADTPWYSSLKLYRQLKPRDWGDVMERVVADLRAFVKGRG